MDRRFKGDLLSFRPLTLTDLPLLHEWLARPHVAEWWSRGFGHVTTRQNVQFHFVKLHDVELAMRRLAEAGLTTREACGNSVRNITGCAFAGAGPAR